MRLLYTTGMRIGELDNLKFCDVNYDDQRIFIRAGKGDKDRYVLTDKRTLEELKEWQGDKQVSERVVGIRIRQLRRVVERAGAITGIAAKYEAMGRTYSPHCFRHAFATHLYEQGTSLFVIKKLLGHEYLTTTEIYVTCSMETMRKEYNKFNPFKGLNR